MILYCTRYQSSHTCTSFPWKLSKSRFGKCGVLLCSQQFLVYALCLVSKINWNPKVCVDELVIPEWSSLLISAAKLHHYHDCCHGYHLVPSCSNTDMKSCQYLLQTTWPAVMAGNILPTLKQLSNLFQTCSQENWIKMVYSWNMY